MKKLPRLCSDVNEIIKVLSAHKLEKRVTENLDLHWKTTQKIQEKRAQRYRK